MTKKINLADLVFKVSDDGSLKVFAGDAKKAGAALNKVKKGTEDTTYATKKGINQTANQTKNFANLARGISGSLVPAYATLAANVFALTAVFGFLQQAADFRVLKEGQQAYAAVTGIAYQTLTNSIVEATDAQIRYTDAAQAAAIGTAAGLSPEQLEKLGAAAKTVSIALGRDVTDSFNRLVRGVTKAEPELLDELGIILRLETATKEYAAQLGVSKESLDAFQRTQAVTGNVLDQVEQKYSAINAILDPQTNQIQKLTKAFDDLMNSFRSFIAGPAEALANFFANNLTASIGALGLFALPIIQSLLPAFDDLAANAEASLGRHDAAFERAKMNLNQYKDTSAQAKAQAERTFNTLQTKAQGLAGQAGLPKGRAGSGLRNLQEGRSITPRQAAAIKRQISNTESMYFISNKKIRRNFMRTMDEIVMADKVKSGKIKVQIKGLELFYKKSFAAIKVGFRATMVGMTTAAATAGRLISKAFGFMSAISIALLAFEGLKAGAEKLGLFTSGVDSADTALGKMLNTQKDLNKELEEMLGADKKLAAENIDLGLTQNLKRAGDRLTSARLGSTFKALQASMALTKQFEGAFDPAKDTGNMVMMATSASGSVPDLSGIDTNPAVTIGETTMTLQQFNAETKAQEEMLETLTKRVSILAESYPDMFSGMLDSDGNLIVTKLTDEQHKLIDSYTTTSSALKSLENGEKAYGQAIQARLGKQSPERALLLQAQARLRNRKKVQEGDAFKKERNAEQQQAFIDETGVQETIVSALEKADASARLLVTEKARIAIATQSMSNRMAGNTRLMKIAKDRLKIEQNLAEVKALQAQITEKQTLLETGKASDEESTRRSIEDLQNRITLLNQQRMAIENSIDPVHQLGTALSNAFEKTLTSSIQGLLDGTKNLKEAFLDMTRAVLNSIAQIVAQQAAMAVMTAVGFPGARGGGIMKKSGRSYSVGGVARGPQSGYPAMLHGTEAVVPLPNGRSIPVEMQGGGGNVNNVVINVDAGGNASSTFNEEQGKALGMAIQASVMETLQREKRPGGVLS